MTEEQKKDELKFKLIQLNYFKTPEGRQLYELSLDELESILKNINGLGVNDGYERNDNW